MMPSPIRWSYTASASSETHQHEVGVHSDIRVYDDPQRDRASITTARCVFIDATYGHRPEGQADRFTMRIVASLTLYAGT